MSIALMCFRHDLRLNENPAFIQACSRHEIIVPIYMYDPKNSTLGQAQSWWLHHSLSALSASLNKRGLKLVLRKGNPINIILDLAQTIPLDAVYWNRSYEPETIEKDNKIKTALLAKGIELWDFNGSLFHEPWTIKNYNGEYFKVFTPYWKQCLKQLHSTPPMSLGKKPNGLDLESEDLQDWNLLPTDPNWANRFSELWTPGEEGAQEKLHDFISNKLMDYKNTRDFPAKNSTSHLSPHVHFGEISPLTILRSLELARLNPKSNLSSIDCFLSELGWREFSAYLLYHFPKLPYENCRSSFNEFHWDNDPVLLRSWQKGLTGFPIVDAGMRELWATGYMHNRLRMITASFLTKDLLIDWRLGASWFLDTLVDADQANNSASWQWVSGSGIDPAPYFRIFNPVVQSQKFDPDGTYIRTWVPELSKLDNKTIHAPWEYGDSKEIYAQAIYPKPVVNHSEARVRALFRYKAIK